ALAVAGVAALVVFGLTWHLMSEDIRVRRYAQLAIGFHLLVAFVAYWRGREPNAFWQFNRALFLRFLLAGLYAGVLYTGLTVALIAIDQLFKAHVSEKVYFRLWLW